MTINSMFSWLCSAPQFQLIDKCSNISVTLLNNIFTGVLYVLWMVLCLPKSSVIWEWTPQIDRAYEVLFTCKKLLYTGLICFDCWLYICVGLVRLDRNALGPFLVSDLVKFANLFSWRITPFMKMEANFLINVSMKFDVNSIKFA